MLRREFLLASAASALSGQTRRPNIVVLLADDLGYGDPACYGGAACKTPHIDRLAASGLRFRNFYAASAVCSPSRAAILTGRYPLRYDIRKAFSDDEAHLPAHAVTLPRLLRDAGYATAHVGKWHLGGLHRKHLGDRGNSIPGPHQHGFDHYQCQNEEQPMRGRMGKERTLFRQGGTCLIRDEQPVTKPDPYYRAHFTDINGDEAIRSIERAHAGGRPFFLNVWFLDPHQPYEPAPEPFWSAAASPGITDDQRRFRSMVAHMDHQIGRIVATLERLKLRDHTLIVFTSDNGGAYEADIGPYRGGKTDLHEGGIRVPGIVSWPDRVKAGGVTDTFAHHVDLLPTLCAAAGVAHRAVDGVDLMPLLRGGSAPKRSAVFWQIDAYGALQRHYPRPKPHATEAVREGPWKLLAKDGVPTELFHLGADPLEERNLLEREPERAARLTEALRAFLAAPRDRAGFPKPAAP